MLVFAPFVLRTSFTNVVLLFLTFTIVEEVARTKSTARPIEGPIRRPERGGSEWEPIKILLEGD
jgi:hypothetical protein